MQYESERIEYKFQMIDDIYKEVIAFANTDGGVIYFGIDDKGNLIGIDNVDENLHAPDQRHPRCNRTGCDHVRAVCPPG